MALNKVILQGRLTAVPELKQTPSGLSVLSVRIAVDRKKKEDGADFITITAWRQTAEFIAKYFSKGQEILVCGSLQSRTYEDRNGNKRTEYEVLADEVYFCGKAEKQEPTAIPYVPTGYAKTEQSGTTGQVAFPETESGLPF